MNVNVCISLRYQWKDMTTGKNIIKQYNCVMFDLSLFFNKNFYKGRISFRYGIFKNETSGAPLLLPLTTLKGGGGGYKNQAKENITKTI